MKRLSLVIIALCTLIASETMAGSGQSWGIGLGAGAAGYMLGRSQSRRSEPRYTEVVTVQAPSSNLTGQLEAEQNRCRQLRKEVEELEEKNKRLDRKLDRFEENLEKLEKENKELKEKLKEQTPQASKGFFN